MFSKTAGFRHSSIDEGIAAIRQLGAQNGFSVTATEDASAFTTANLNRYQAVVWLSTTGDVLNNAQQGAFETYIQGGGGYVGVHAAADTEYGWSWYGGLVGAYFASHPANQEARIRVTDRSNVSTAHLPQTWTRTDVLHRWHHGDHPITWCHNYRGGRAWYTGLGHTEQSYSDPNFTRMLLGGIQLAGGARAADCCPETGYTPLFDGTQASLDRRWTPVTRSRWTRRTLTSPERPAGCTASRRRTSRCASGR